MSAIVVLPSTYRMISKLFLIATLLLTAFIAAASGSVPGIIVNADWLQNQLTRDNIIIVDVRPRTQYRKSHIDGAVSLPSEDMFARLKRIEPQNEAAKLFSRAGITTLDSVVIYDDGRLIDAARMFWAFEVYGHASLAVLEGGYPNWKSSKLPVRRGIEPRTHRAYHPHIMPVRVATRLQSQLAVNNPHVTRVLSSTEKKTGQSAKGIVQISLGALFDNNQSGRVFKKPAELEKVFSAVPKRNRIVVSCPQGRDCALQYLAMRLLDYNVSLYDGPSDQDDLTWASTSGAD